MKKIFVDMDGVLVNFQSGIDKLDDATMREYADDGNGKPHYDDVPGNATGYPISPEFLKEMKDEWFGY